MARVIKDRWNIKILNSKLLYFIILLFFLLFFYTNSKLLNVSVLIRYVHFIIAIFIVLLYIYWRVLLFPSYYKSKFKDIIYIISSMVFIFFFAFIFSFIITIPFNIAVMLYSMKNTITYYDCRINNATTIGLDEIQFEFEGKNSYLNYNIKSYDRKDLVQNYYLRIGLKKAFCEVYYIENKSFVLKKIE